MSLAQPNTRMSKDGPNDQNAQRRPKRTTSRKEVTYSTPNPDYSSGSSQRSTIVQKHQNIEILLDDNPVVVLILPLALLIRRLGLKAIVLKADVLHQLRELRYGALGGLFIQPYIPRYQ
ncbi:hypothetical protein CCMA1212_003173 [Trichoderma ghanense]|uniref:Uncharacterized protein n=1 Tax=Trichoderma ghanense TaxID=65468 RepID=A0ABY2HBA6_9HYPO